MMNSKKINNFCLIVLILFLFPLNAFQQKKNFTCKQAFGFGEPRLTACPSSTG